jgi:hypothetical protein
MPDRVLVFEMGRGPDEEGLAVSLPASWAAPHERVEVMFRKTERFGWKATVVSASGERILGFPWADDADRMLRGEIPSELPDAALEEDWDDLDQGWWAVIRVLGDDLLIAETDLDSLIAVTGSPVPRSVRSGIVDVGGVDVAWNRVPRAAWERAWAAARTSCERGEPRPVAPSHEE